MKIILALKTGMPDMSLIDFGCYIAKLTKSEINGIFLDAIAHTSHTTYTEIESGNNTESINKEIMRFKEACTVRETRCHVNQDPRAPLETLLKETRFADLLIIDSDMSFSANKESSPSHFVQKVLREAECPVIIAPPSSKPIEEILFAYDGNPSSMFALKEFTHLFPELKETKITTIEVCDMESVVYERHEIKEWLNQHYSKIDFIGFFGSESNTLLANMLIKENCIVVMGSYGRTALSNFFRRSHADILMKITAQPLFIAHS